MRFYLSVFTGILFLLAFCGAAEAADPLATIPVKERAFDSFEPKGLKLGKLTVFPALETKTVWTSNVFQQENAAASDRIFIVRPVISALLPLGDHRFDFTFEAERQIYAEYDSQTRTDYTGRAAGRFALSPAVTLETGIEAERHHPGRLDLSAPEIPEKPVAVDEKGFFTTLILKPSRLHWRLDLAARDIAHDDGTALETGNTVVFRDRDRSVYEAGGEVAYETGRRWKPFIGFSFSRAVFDRRDYIDGSGFSGPLQDRNRYAVNAGLDLSPAGKLRGRLAVGYGYENPDDETLDEGSTGLVDIDLTYLYSPLTNFTLNAGRFFANDVNAAQSIIETRLSAGIIHELTRRWILEAGADYRIRDFQNTGEEDDTLTGFLGAGFKINDRFRLGGEIRHITRNSNRPGGGFDETRALIRLRSAF